MTNITPPTGGERSPWYSLDGFGGYLKLRILNPTIFDHTKLADAIYKKLSEGTLNAASLRWFTSKQLTALKEKIITAKQFEPDTIDEKIAKTVKEALSFTRKESRQTVLNDIIDLTEPESTEYTSRVAKQEPGARGRGNLLYEVDEDVVEPDKTHISDIFRAPSRVRGDSDLDTQSVSSEEETEEGEDVGRAREPSFEADVKAVIPPLMETFRELENRVSNTQLNENEKADKELSSQWEKINDLKQEIDAKKERNELPSLDEAAKFELAMEVLKALFKRRDKK